jgi:hypothetical protein
MALPGAIMTEERLAELERTRCTRVYMSPDDVPELIAEIRRLQAELTEVQIDRNNYELLNRLKIVTIEKHEAELARLRQVFEKAGKFVEAVNADSFEDGALYKALNDAVSQWTPSKAKEAGHE